ncbi:hypothetical protein PZA11_005767 [Diplocarpon coronariae]
MTIIIIIIIIIILTAKIFMNENDIQGSLKVFPEPCKVSKFQGKSSFKIQSQSIRTACNRL